MTCLRQAFFFPFEALISGRFYPVAMDTPALEISGSNMGMTAERLLGGAADDILRRYRPELIVGCFWRQTRQERRTGEPGLQREEGLDERCHFCRLL